MDSILNLYRVGRGPSSSHTMGPSKAAKIFKQQHPQANNIRVTLFGSLAATGKGHLTDMAIRDVFSSQALEIVWKPDALLPLHPNGMLFEALDSGGSVHAAWEVYSVGGGALQDQGQVLDASPDIYDLSTLTDIVAQCKHQGQALWEYVASREGDEIWEQLKEIWRVMQTSIEAGLQAEGVLPGELGVPRKAWAFYRRTQLLELNSRRSGLLSAYALAVSEENASGGIIVTAPTCGACGVLPAVLRYVWEMTNCAEDAVLRALATAGLIGNLVKHNGSISGAQVGCQGEVGTACSMAAGAAAQLMGGSVSQIEYAAAMGLEHNLGLTCDPVLGLVQIPCIERNAFAANNALSSADYALFTDGNHRIPFDDVVEVMLEVGKNMPSLYRETSQGGLASVYQRRLNP